MWLTRSLLACILVLRVGADFTDPSNFHYDEASESGERLAFKNEEVKIIEVNMTSGGTPSSKVFAPGVSESSPHMHLDDFIEMLDGHHDYEGGVLHNPNATSHLETALWTGREDDDHEELDHSSRAQRQLLNLDLQKPSELRNDMTTSAFMCLQLDIGLDPFCPVCTVNLGFSGNLAKSPEEKCHALAFQLSLGFTVGLTILGKTFGFSIQLQGTVEINQHMLAGDTACQQNEKKTKIVTKQFSRWEMFMAFVKTVYFSSRSNDKVELHVRKQATQLTPDHDIEVVRWTALSAELLQYKTAQSELDTMKKTGDILEESKQTAKKAFDSKNKQLMEKLKKDSEATREVLPLVDGVQFTHFRFSEQLENYGRMAARNLYFDDSKVSRSLLWTFADGRNLHRNWVGSSLHSIKRGDIHKVINIPRVGENAISRNKPKFWRNLAVGFANLFVRSIKDIQGLFNIYHAFDVNWDGECISLLGLVGSKSHWGEDKAVPDQHWFGDKREEANDDKKDGFGFMEKQKECRKGGLTLRRTYLEPTCAELIDDADPTKNSVTDYIIQGAVADVEALTGGKQVDRCKGETDFKDCVLRRRSPFDAAETGHFFAGVNPSDPIKILGEIETLDLNQNDDVSSRNQFKNPKRGRYQKYFGERPPLSHDLAPPVWCVVADNFDEFMPPRSIRGFNIPSITRNGSNADFSIDNTDGDGTCKVPDGFRKKVLGGKEAFSTISVDRPSECERTTVRKATMNMYPRFFNESQKWLGKIRAIITDIHETYGEENSDALSCELEDDTDCNIPLQIFTKRTAANGLFQAPHDQKERLETCKCKKGHEDDSIKATSPMRTRQKTLALMNVVKAWFVSLEGVSPECANREGASDKTFPVGSCGKKFCPKCSEATVASEATDAKRKENKHNDKRDKKSGKKNDSQESDAANDQWGSAAIDSAMFFSKADSTKAVHGDSKTLSEDKLYSLEGLMKHPRDAMHMDHTELFGYVLLDPTNDCKDAAGKARGKGVACPQPKDMKGCEQPEKGKENLGTCVAQKMKEGGFLGKRRWGMGLDMITKHSDKILDVVKNRVHETLETMRKEPYAYVRSAKSREFDVPRMDWTFSLQVTAETTNSPGFCSGNSGLLAAFLVYKRAGQNFPDEGQVQDAKDAYRVYKSTRNLCVGMNLRPMTADISFTHCWLNEDKFHKIPCKTPKCSRHSELLQDIKGARRHSELLLAGTATANGFTDISKAASAVITAANTFLVDQVVTITLVEGMTEINNLKCTVTAPSSLEFTCAGLDSTGFTDFTSGGKAEDESWLGKRSWVVALKEGEKEMLLAKAKKEDEDDILKAKWEALSSLEKINVKAADLKKSTKGVQDAINHPSSLVTPALEAIKAGQAAMQDAINHPSSLVTPAVEAAIEAAKTAAIEVAKTTKKHVTANAKHHAGAVIDTAKAGAMIVTDKEAGAAAAKVRFLELSEPLSDDSVEPCTATAGNSGSEKIDLKAKLNEGQCNQARPRGWPGTVESLPEDTVFTMAVSYVLSDGQVRTMINKDSVAASCLKVFTNPTEGGSAGVSQMAQVIAGTSKIIGGVSPGVGALLSEEVLGYISDMDEFEFIVQAFNGGVEEDLAKSTVSHSCEQACEYQKTMDEQKENPVETAFLQVLTSAGKKTGGEKKKYDESKKGVNTCQEACVKKMENTKVNEPTFHQFFLTKDKKGNFKEVPMCAVEEMVVKEDGTTVERSRMPKWMRKISPLKCKKGQNKDCAVEKVPKGYCAMDLKQIVPSCQECEKCACTGAAERARGGCQCMEKVAWKESSLNPDSDKSKLIRDRDGKQEEAAGAEAARLAKDSEESVEKNEESLSSPPKATKESVKKNEESLSSPPKAISSDKLLAIKNIALKTWEFLVKLKDNKLEGGLENDPFADPDDPKPVLTYGFSIEKEIAMHFSREHSSNRQKDFDVWKTCARPFYAANNGELERKSQEFAENPDALKKNAEGVLAKVDKECGAKPDNPYTFDASLSAKGAVVTPPITIGTASGTFTAAAQADFSIQKWFVDALEESKADKMTLAERIALETVAQTGGETLQAAGAAVTKIREEGNLKDGVVAVLENIPGAPGAKEAASYVDTADKAVGEGVIDVVAAKKDAKKKAQAVAAKKLADSKSAAAMSNWAAVKQHLRNHVSKEKEGKPDFEEMTSDKFKKELMKINEIPYVVLQETSCLINCKHFACVGGSSACTKKPKYTLTAAGTVHSNGYEHCEVVIFDRPPSAEDCAAGDLTDPTPEESSRIADGDLKIFKYSPALSGNKELNKFKDQMEFGVTVNMEDSDEETEIRLEGIRTEVHEVDPTPILKKLTFTIEPTEVATFMTEKEQQFDAYKEAMNSIMNWNNGGKEKASERQREEKDETQKGKIAEVNHYEQSATGMPCCCNADGAADGAQRGKCIPLVLPAADGAVAKVLAKSDGAVAKWLTDRIKKKKCEYPLKKCKAQWRKEALKIHSAASLHFVGLLNMIDSIRKTKEATKTDAVKEATKFFKQECTEKREQISKHKGFINFVSHSKQELKCAEPEFLEPKKEMPAYVQKMMQGNIGGCFGWSCTSTSEYWVTAEALFAAFSTEYEFYVTKGTIASKDENYQRLQTAWRAWLDFYALFGRDPEPLPGVPSGDVLKKLEKSFAAQEENLKCLIGECLDSWTWTMCDRRHFHGKPSSAGTWHEHVEFDKIETNQKQYIEALAQVKKTPTHMWAQAEYKIAEKGLQRALEAIFDPQWQMEGDKTCSEVTFEVGHKRFKFKQDEKKLVKTTISNI